MPVYTFHCEQCNTKKDFLRSVSERNKRTECGKCHSEMQRRVEGFKLDTFEPYYDEGLGSDITSRRARKSIMSRLGVIEAGDPIGGSRNFDSKNPNVIKKQPLRGVFKRFAKSEDATIVQTIDAGGHVVEQHRSDELSY